MDAFSELLGKETQQGRETPISSGQTPGLAGGAVPQVAGTFHVVHFQDGCDFCMECVVLS